MKSDNEKKLKQLKRKNNRKMKKQIGKRKEIFGKKINKENTENKKQKT